ncbi:hypothetical protein K488DRAFT_89250 [Vararia minispora EC-137]|uniref:Uncharacterized protein n=1 Tax=Vararia minispora EC-137 TaxID=1314806 RepID=A0ACB8QAR5_9AGAM|nr:hypothetical protein K488DRAFT_89250 [Vararia minispora EC-137]
MANLHRALSALPRIVEIKLSFPDTRLPISLRLLSCHAAKELRKLKIIGPTASFVNLPPHIFSDTPPPYLRLLKLEYCSFHHYTSHAALYPPSLTSLSLVWCPGAFGSMEQVLSVFRSLASLRYLQLSGPRTLPVYFERHDLDVPREPPYLPQLKYFCADLPFVVMANLLHTIRFPTTTGLTIGMRFLDNEISWDIPSRRLLDFSTRIFSPAREASMAYTNIRASLTMLETELPQFDLSLSSLIGGSSRPACIPDQLDVVFGWNDLVRADRVEDLARQFVQTLPLPASDNSLVSAAQLRFRQDERTSMIHELPEHGWWRLFEHTKLDDLHLIEGSAIQDGLAWLERGPNRLATYSDITSLSVVSAWLYDRELHTRILDHLAWCMDNPIGHFQRLQVRFIDCYMTKEATKPFQEKLGEDMVEILEGYDDDFWAQMLVEDELKLQEENEV